MTNETYSKLEALRDQMINMRWNTFGLDISILAGIAAKDEIVKICREAGHKVSIRLIGKGEPDAEYHLRIV